ncbi:hypothetical protein NAL32_07265 [Chryseobacterium sp. Ch-15]|uniref:Uncharacterized protein n=1 Tax=Chryseobacterium muglaense TaxID=2893752 RepID=A0A9Q3UV75_9FLAO|nr:hypothetical protein [Chryseobacterium muglaense]MBD3905268.1 hypothetical protein [Chryseobacterium muglaense]MCC9033974.1 hypothetical protein [Chryseobacterium muglaense]MCM2554193.1 hypothetical protein [Chryseobacterium muglaense]
MKLTIRILITILSLTIVSNCNEKLSQPISFFEDYDLTSGKYKLEIYHVEGEIIDDFKNFYIDDPETLNKMKKQWIFKYKSEVMPCGFGYELHLIEDKKVIKKTLINIDCEYMSGWVYFPKEYLTDHKNHFKRIN